MNHDRYGSPTFADVLVRTLTAWGDRDAFVAENRRYTYRQTADLIARFISVLEKDGPLKGRGVGVLSVNEPTAWMVMAATKISGGYVVALPALSAAQDLAFFVTDSNISTLVVHPDLAEKGAEVVAQTPGLTSVYSLGFSELAPNLLTAAERESPRRLQVAPGIGADDVCQIFYTGGTTSRSKGATHTHRSWMTQLLDMPAGLQVPYGPRYLAAAPISHQAYPFIAPTLVSGGTVYTIPRFEPELFARTVADQRITFTTGVPTMMYSLLDHAQNHSTDLSSIQSFVYGAGPMSIDRLVEAQSRFGQVFTQAYGLVEALGMCTALPPAMHDVDSPAQLASAGIPYSSTTLTILNESGDELPDGQVGEICIRTRAAMRGYWNQPEETEHVFRGGWLHTGDAGIRDDDGFITIVDRIKDIIISGGYNIYAAEIEQIIARDPAVSSVAVVGLPDEKWGEAVTAVVVATPGHTVDTARIQELVKRTKGPVHTPKTVRVTAELPTTPAGKINKRALRDSLRAPSDVISPA